MVAPRARAADIDQMIATAKTATDHQAIANYFDQEAAQANNQVARHQKMKQAYETSVWRPSSAVRSESRDFSLPGLSPGCE